MADRTRRVVPFRLARDGATAIEFAFILPALVVFTVGLIEMALILFDYHRAGEATRQAVRAFEIGPAITSFANLPRTCDKDTSASCDAARIDAVIDGIKGSLPRLVKDNLRITYNDSGLDIAGNSSVVTPVITVSIVDLKYEFFILNAIVPGVPDDFTFPAFSTSRIVQSVVQ